MDLYAEGLRSGDQAISRNSIDAVLNNPNRVDETMPRAAGEKSAVLGDIPQLGRLFRSGLDSNARYDGLAQREMVRRQSAVVEGDRLLLEGREAMQKGTINKRSINTASRSTRFPTLRC